MRRPFQKFSGGCSAVGLAVILGATGWGQAPETARGLLEKADAFYRGLESFQVTTEMALEVSGEGLPENLSEALVQTISARRPNAFALVSKGQGEFLSHPMAWLHRGTGTLVLPGQGLVRQENVPSIEEFFLSETLGYTPAVKANFLFEQNIGLSLLNKLAFAKLGRNWIEELPGAEIVETDVEVGGRKAVHLLLKTGSDRAEPGPVAAMDLHLWLAQGDQPLLLKLQPDVNPMLREGDPEGKAPVEMEMTVEWRDWKLNPKLPDSAFQPPAEFQEREYATAWAMMEAAQTPGMDMLGEPAPALNLPVPGQKEPLDLQSYQGEKIVILTFWATWCQPCKEAFPVLMKVTEEFAGDGVVLVGVNVEEPEEVVAPFLEREEMELLTALDVDGKVSSAFQVQNIPQTVIIGKDGLVKHVHVGFGPDFEELLKRELSFLLDGGGEESEDAAASDSR